MTDVGTTLAVTEFEPGLTECPYRGLRPYTESDTEYFFGREAECDLVLANLMASRVTVLCGPSGVGKSSLLQAGVLRELRHISEGAFSFLAAERVIPVYFAAWRDDPFRGLARALHDALPAGPDRDAVFAGQRPISVDLVREVIATFDADVYFLLDQLEELELYQRGAVGDEFAAALGLIITAAGLRSSVLLGIREDALAKLDRFKGHVSGFFDHYLSLDHLSAEAARAAIEGPLHRYNMTRPAHRHVHIEPALVVELLDQLRIGRVAVTDIGSGAVDDHTMTIETPFLQLVMTRLWTEEVERQGSRTLRLSALQNLGGAERIVRTHLDDVMSHLTDDQREVASRVFRHLVTPSGTKIAHSVEDLADYAGIVDPIVLTELLESLSSGQHRVLRPVPPPVDSVGPARYEIFHDVMAPAVLDWRRRYVAERERQDSERELLLAREEAEAEHHETRRRLRRSRLFSAALAVLLVVCSAALVFAKIQSDTAAQRASLSDAASQMEIDPAASLSSALGAWDTKGDQQSETAVRLALDADHNRLLLHPDMGAVISAQYSPDGKSLVAIGTQGNAELFDAKTGAFLRPFIPTSGSDAGSRSAASFSNDGTLVATNTDAGEVVVYDTDTGAVIATPGDPGNGFGATAKWGVQEGAAVLVISSADGQPAKLWNSSTGAYVTFGDDSTLKHYYPSLSPDGKRLASIGVDNDRNRIVLLWDATTGQEIGRTPYTLLEAFSPRFYLDSDHVAFVGKQSARDNYRVYLWNHQDDSAQPAEAAGTYYSRIDSNVTVSNDGGLIAYPADKTVAIMDVDGTLVGNIPEQSDWISAVKFSPDGESLAVGLEDGSVTIWRSRDFNNQPTTRLMGHKSIVNDIEFSPSAQAGVVTAGSDGTIRTWQLPDERDEMVIQSTTRVINADLSSDGSLIFTAHEYGDWETTRTTDLQQVDGGDTPGAGILISAHLAPDDRTVGALMRWSAAPQIWQLGSDRTYRLDRNDAYLKVGPKFSNDSKLVVAADYQNRLVIWDVDSGKIVQKIPAGEPRDWALNVSFVPGSNMVAAAGSDGHVRMWTVGSSIPTQDVATGQLPIIRAINFSSDGRNLVTVTEDNKLLIYRLSDTDHPIMIDGPPSSISAVDFSPDQELVAASAADGAIYVWSRTSGEPRGVLHRHGDVINSLRFMPDGHTFLTASDDGTAAMVPCSVACESQSTVIDQARSRVNDRFPAIR